MLVYLAGTYSRPWVFDESMKIYLAGIAPWMEQGIYQDAIGLRPYILESYYYLAKDVGWPLSLRSRFKGFLLDSGAFSFMSGANKVDFDTYTQQYGEYIKHHNIQDFFELDIDVVVGIKEVERLRAKLEGIVGRQCIPVWHRSRGDAYWKRLVKEYKYVGIGGIVSKEIKSTEYGIFNYLINLAGEEGCRVHGLGFTNLEGVKKYKFYSVDSTGWLYGNRGGFIYRFNGHGLEKVKRKGMRLNARLAAAHNFGEWVKFGHYAHAHY